MLFVWWLLGNRMKAMVKCVENYKKILIAFGCLLLFALLAPVILAWLNVFLSPYISTIGFTAIIFIATVVIAWYGKIGRK